MKTIEILWAARGLIEDPERWTQGAWARDAEGLSVDPDSQDAVCWCAAGALWRFLPPGADIDYGGAYAALQDAASWGLTEANDGRDGHAAVLAVFDRAIEAVEGAAD